MVETLIEIPLPGRTFAPPDSPALGRSHCARVPSFVAGEENRVVASVVGGLISTAQCEFDTTRTEAASSPVIYAIFGPSGVGKTHLLRGLVAQWQLRRGAASAEYIPAADFRRQFLDAMHRDEVADFRRRFRGRELLAIDDLQQLPDDSYLMEELRYTLDECHEAGGRVLVSSPRAASTLPNLPADVRDRLSGGLSLQLAAPGLAARLAIVRQAAAALGRPLSEAAASRLAGAVAGMANDLFAALFELLSADAARAGSDVEQVEKYLTSREAGRTTLREVIAVVARYYRLSQKLLKSNSRKQAVVLARATVVYLARELAHASYEQIGQALGGRDHSTIMHSYRTIELARERDWQTQETLDELRRILLCR